MNLATFFASMPSLRRIADTVEMLCLLSLALVIPLVTLSDVLLWCDALEVFDVVVERVPVDVMNVASVWNRSVVVLPHVSMKIGDSSTLLRSMPVQTVGPSLAVRVPSIFSAVPFHSL